MRLERDDEFWEIELSTYSFVVRQGRIGTIGKSRFTKFANVHEAQRAHEHAISAALATGFHAPAEGDDGDVDIRDAVLEQALRDHRDDPDAYLVYADWLQAEGNPIGELIALAVRDEVDGHRDREVQARLDALRCELLPSLHEGVTVQGRFGFWRSLRIENQVRERATIDAVSELACEAFSHMMCTVLDELVIGELGWRGEEQLVAAVIEQAGAYAWARYLRRLHVGMDDPGKPQSAFYSRDYDPGALGFAISSVFPGLESLRLNVAARQLRGLELASLRELVVVGDFDGVLEVSAPALERLELWLGGWANDAAPAELTAVIGAQSTMLRYLALRNAIHADDLAAVIPMWPIAGRLATLDLSWGALSDDGARVLLDATSLAGLEHLVVDKCYLSNFTVRELETRFPRVSAAEQRSPTTADRRVIAYRPSW